MTEGERYDLAIHRAYEKAVERLFETLIANATGSSSFEQAVNRYKIGLALTERAFKVVRNVG